MLDIVLLFKCDIELMCYHFECAYRRKILMTINVKCAFSRFKPSHCPNQWWFIVCWTANKCQWNLNQNIILYIQGYAFEFCSGQVDVHWEVFFCQPDHPQILVELISIWDAMTRIWNAVLWTCNSEAPQSFDIGPLYTVRKVKWSNYQIIHNWHRIPRP